MRHTYLLDKFRRAHASVQVQLRNIAEAPDASPYVIDKAACARKALAKAEAAFTAINERLNQKKYLRRKTA